MRIWLPKWSTNKSKTWTLLSIETSMLGLWVVAIKGSCVLPWQFLAILLSYYWMSHLQEWTLRQGGSCGESWLSWPNKERKVQSYWQLIQWKKLKHCPRKWGLWSKEARSSALEAHNTWRASMELAMKLKSKSRKLMRTSWRNIKKNSKLEQTKKRFPSRRLTRSSRKKSRERNSWMLRICT